VGGQAGGLAGRPWTRLHAAGLGMGASWHICYFAQLSPYLTRLHAAGLGMGASWHICYFAQLSPYLTRLHAAGLGMGASWHICYLNFTQLSPQLTSWREEPSME